MQSAQHPLSRIGAVLLPGCYYSGIAPVFSCQVLHGGQIAFQVSASYTETGTEICMRPDPPVEPECRHDFVPVGSNPFAYLRKGI